jgi:hypothetical protein
MARVESATPTPDASFLDMIDLATPKQGDFLVVNRGAGTNNDAPASFSDVLLNASSGSPNTTEIFGAQWIGFLSQAAVSFRGSRYCQVGVRTPWWPMGVDWTGFPASAKALNLRYRFTVQLQRTVPVVGDGRFGVALNYSVTGTSAGLVSEDAATAVGIEVSSKPSVNGGNWTAFWRTTSGGALSAGVDLGLAPNGEFQALGFQYDLTTKLCGFLVEGVVTAILPVAQIPNPTSHAGNPVQYLNVAAYNGGVANQQDRFGLSRLTILRVS